MGLGEVQHQAMNSHPCIVFGAMLFKLGLQKHSHDGLHPRIKPVSELQDKGPR